ncbi:hypothetical protein OHV05_37625 (plasmid) [Kitasatospora sp. NBC_00070]
MTTITVQLGASQADEVLRRMREDQIRRDAAKAGGASGSGQ